MCDMCVEQCACVLCVAGLLSRPVPGHPARRRKPSHERREQVADDDGRRRRSFGCRSRDLSRQVASRLYAPERLHAQISNLLIYKYRYSVLLAIVCMWLVTHSRAAIMY